MKTDFSLQVNVTIGVSDLLATFLTCLTQPTQPAEVKAEASEAEAKAEPQEAEKPAPKPQAVKPKEADKPSPLTEVDVRAAIHETRQRIEGEDYKDNPTSEAYQRYHKALSDLFRQTATLLGADKPSKLPADKIPTFIERCKEFEILDDGTVGIRAPF